MRSDLAKLTTEAPRRGRGYAAVFKTKYGGNVRIVHSPDHDYENEYGGFRSSARRRHKEHKEFSDVLGPMIGALRKNVGRPWDDVYSEFCQFLDRRSVSGIHIFGHLCGKFGEVKVNGLFVGKDGKVYEYPRGGYFPKYARYQDGTKFKASEVDDFYVHPHTGILCYKEPKRVWGSRLWRKKAELEGIRSGKVSIDNKDYEYIGGCWFEVVNETRVEWRWKKFYSQKPGEWQKRIYGLTFDHDKQEWGEWYESQPFLVATKKRSLSCKEIKMVRKFIKTRLEELGDNRNSRK